MVPGTTTRLTSRGPVCGPLGSVLENEFWPQKPKASYVSSRGLLPKNRQQKCAYHQDQKGHTADECMELRTVIHDLISSGRMSYMWGPHTVLTYDQPEPGMSVTEHTLIFRHNFTAFKDSHLGIYLKLVRGGILTLAKKKARVGVSSLGSEIIETCLIMEPGVTTLKSSSCSIMMWSH
ncbi:hypothetical protein KY289_028987 [Solanum tuberosum]|nr:hypothetical protein KY289_028987 [Solanum tuberosum]